MGEGKAVVTREARVVLTFPSTLRVVVARRGEALTFLSTPRGVPRGAKEASTSRNTLEAKAAAARVVLSTSASTLRVARREAREASTSRNSWVGRGAAARRVAASTSRNSWVGRVAAARRAAASISASTRRVPAVQPTRRRRRRVRTSLLLSRQVAHSITPSSWVVATRRPRRGTAPTHGIPGLLNLIAGCFL